MRQNHHKFFSSRHRHLISVPTIRIVQAAASIAVLCLCLGTVLPAQGQTSSATPDKKSKKKTDTTAQKKTTPTSEAAARVVVVFPPETKGGVSDQIADAITDVVQSRLNLSGKYKATLFTPALPTIRRAVIDTVITRDQVANPVASDALVKKLTDLTGHDMAFVVSIIDYQFDKATKKVSMVMSAKLLDYTGPAPRGTNRNGDSPDKPGTKATEYDLAAALARDLTEKMVTDLLAPPKPAAVEEKK